MLAAASNAIIVGFQVRPSASARKLAEKEEIEIRLYSIIYDAINDIKDAIEGMLEPVMKEEIVASVDHSSAFYHINDCNINRIINYMCNRTYQFYWTYCTSHCQITHKTQ